MGARVMLMLAMAVAVGCSASQDLPYDPVPPTLEVTHPARGTTTTDFKIWVEGSFADDVGVKSIRINGVTVKPKGPRSREFSYELQLKEGVNLIRTVVTDHAGNETEDVRAVLSGEFNSVKEPVTDGIAFGMSRDPLNVIAKSLTAKLEAEVDAWLPQISESETLDLGFGGCLGAEADIHGVSYDDLRVRISPVRDGIKATVQLIGLGIDADITYWVLCLEGDTTLTFGTDRVEAAFEINMRLRDGKIETDVSELSTKVVNLGFDVDGAPEAVINILEVDFAEALGGLIGDVVSTTSEPILNAAMQVLARGRTFDFGEEIGKLEAKLFLNNLLFDTRGGIITFDSWTRAANIRPYGYLSNPEPVPSPDSSPGFSVWIADDAINQILFELWSSELFHQTIDTDETLGAIADRVTLNPLLPPVAQASNGGDMNATLGDLLVTLEQDDAVVAEVAVSVDFDFGARVDSLGILELSLDGPVFSWNRLDEGGAIDDRDIEILMVFVSEYIRGKVNSVMTEVPLPSMAGFSFVNPIIRTRGGYLEIGVSLKETPPAEVVAPDPP